MSIYNEGTEMSISDGMPLCWIFPDS